MSTLQRRRRGAGVWKPKPHDQLRICFQEELAAELAEKERQLRDYGIAATSPASMVPTEVPSPDTDMPMSLSTKLQQQCTTWSPDFSGIQKDKIVSSEPSTA